MFVCYYFGENTAASYTNAHITRTNEDWGSTLDEAQINHVDQESSAFKCMLARLLTRITATSELERSAMGMTSWTASK